MTDAPLRQKAAKWYEQQDINRLFEQYDLSFKDPDKIVGIICAHWIQYRFIVWGLERCHPVFEGSGARDLYYLVVQISNTPKHRHRTDAKNIAAECRYRIFKGHAEGPDNPVIPSPEPHSKLSGADLARPLSPLFAPPPTESQRPKAGVERKPTFLTLQMTEAPIDSLPPPPLDPAEEYSKKFVKPNRKPGGPLPRAFKNPHKPIKAPPGMPAEENNEIRRVIESLAVGEKTRELILKEIEDSKDSYNPRLHPERLWDDPGEVCLPLPENCPFVEHQTPKVHEFFASRGHWVPMIIYDRRRRSGAKSGAMGPIEPTNYIWVLFDMIRETLVNPEVARAYAIIARAHPERYTEGSDDDIGDEPPPTKQEIECMIEYVTRSFPPIFIVDESSEESADFMAAVGIGEVFGIAPRGQPKESHRIYLNGALFGQIEMAEREGVPYYHMLLLIVMSFTHELAHYLNTCFYLRLKDDVTIDTPRMMRLVLRPNPKEDPNHVEHIHLLTRRGEIGQVIEWLVFGFMAHPGTELLDPRCFRHPLDVLAWGSYSDPDDQDREIKIDSFAAERLLKARGSRRARMTSLQLREWLRRLEPAREEVRRFEMYTGRRR